MTAAIRKLMLVLALAGLFALAPASISGVSQAQACENETSLLSAESLIEAFFSALREAVQVAIQNAVQSYLFDVALGPILDFVKQLEDSLLGDFAQLATRLIKIFPEIAKQISVARIDQTTKIGFFMDGESQIRAQRTLQNHERRARLAHLFSDLVCSPASGTLGFPGKEATTRAVARAFAYEMTKKNGSLMTEFAAHDPGMGVVKSALAATSARGAVPDIEFRWQEHITKYCEKGENRGKIPCTASGEWTDADVLIGKMVLNQITIEDIADPDYQAALKAMTRNLFEPLYPDPIPKKLLDKPQGILATAARRSERARRNTAYDMFAGAVARRTPDISMFEWNQTLRQAAGISDGDISLTPSYNELMQTFTQARYMAPDYFIKIAGNKPQFEEIVQKTGLLMQLRDEYELTETMAMMYAAQLGMALDRSRPTNTALEER